MIPAIVCLAQTPPNDLFVNRIHLSGDVVTFGGINTGATSYGNDPSEPDPCEPCAPDGICNASIWWSWTAQSATPVIIEKLGAYENRYAGLSVLAGTNLCELQFHWVCDLDLRKRGQYTVFSPQPGTEYQIRMAGYFDTPVMFRLMVTNSPQFRLHPQTQTVSSNASVLFTSSAIGIKPLQYQWQYEGTNVPDGTNQVLVIHNVSTANEGDYRVIVSNPTGVSTSAVARLMLSTNDARPVLSSAQISDGTNFQFTVIGEQGRVYRCETSSDLTNWSGPVLFNTNVSTTFRVRRDSPMKFVRVLQYHPASEVCNCNLKQIWFGIWQFAEDGHRDPTYPVTAADVAPFCMHGEWPRKPDVSPSDPNFPHYTIVDVVTLPTCPAVPLTHVLEEK